MFRPLTPSRRKGWPLAASAVDCPVRVAWGSADRLLPWPSAAERCRRRLLPHAEWVLLDSGHCPQRERPAETASRIRDFTAA